VIDDLIGQIVHIDDSLRDTRNGKLVQDMVEQRLACHFDERLRHAIGQGPHALAEACREYHGFARLDGHFGDFLKWIVTPAGLTTVIRSESGITTP
jgi:hypothetical protein